MGDFNNIIKSLELMLGNELYPYQKEMVKKIYNNVYKIKNEYPNLEVKITLNEVWIFIKGTTIQPKQVIRYINKEEAISDLGITEDQYNDCIRFYSDNTYRKLK